MRRTSSVAKPLHLTLNYQALEWYSNHIPWGTRTPILWPPKAGYARSEDYAAEIRQRSGNDQQQYPRDDPSGTPRTTGQGGRYEKGRTDEKAWQKR